MLKLSALAVFLITSTVNAGLVEDKNDIEIQAKHLETYLDLDSVPNKAIFQLYSNKEKVREKIKNVYLIKAIAEESRKDSLLNNDQIKGQLQGLIDRFYFKIKLKQIMENNLPDFEPLAKLDYQVNKEQYKIEEQIDVSHIMLVEKEHSELEILTLFKDIKQQLNNGADFLELAKKYSEDPTIEKNNGKIGVFSRERLVKEFAEVAFKLKEGEISSEVKTKFGYHLIKLNKYYPARYKEFTEIKDAIIAKIKKEYTTTRREDYFGQLMLENKMQFNDKEIEKYIEKMLNKYEGKKNKVLTNP